MSCKNFSEIPPSVFCIILHGFLSFKFERQKYKDISDFLYRLFLEVKGKA